MYNCAQAKARQQKPKKGKNEAVKERDKDRMDTFDCHGWIHITLCEGGDTALIRFKHEDDHVPYWNIDVPPEVQDYVRKNTQLTPTQVCNRVFLF